MQQRVLEGAFDAPGQLVHVAVKQLGGAHEQGALSAGLVVLPAALEAAGREERGESKGVSDTIDMNHNHTLCMIMYIHLYIHAHEAAVKAREGV